jgi:hypothetical protein
MQQYIYRWTTVVILVVFMALISSDIYNFIINYHIIVYIVLIIAPATGIVKKSLTLPFLFFIQFFWTLLSLTILSYFPFIPMLSLAIKLLTLFIDVIMY